MQEEGRTMSELFREALRQYMEEREWRRRERLERLRSRRTGQSEAQGGQTDERAICSDASACGGSLFRAVCLPR